MSGLSKAILLWLRMDVYWVPANDGKKGSFVLSQRILLFSYNVIKSSITCTKLQEIHMTDYGYGCFISVRARLQISNLLYIRSEQDCRYRTSACYGCTSSQRCYCHHNVINVNFVKKRNITSR